MSKFFVYGDSAIDIERIVKIISYQEAGKPEFVKQIVSELSDSEIEKENNDLP